MGEQPQQLPVAVDVVLLTLPPAPPPAADGGPDPADRPVLVLLARRAEEPFAGHWALPGAMLASGDDLEEAAASILTAVGMPPARHLEQLATFGARDRDPRGRILSVSYLALMAGPAPPVPGFRRPPPAPARPRPHVQQVAWRPASDAAPLAFDHGEILDVAVRRLRGKLTYSTVAFALLPDTFTLSELQGVYEAVLGQRLDKRNFRKKVLSTGMVEPTGQERRGPHRPARLHRFRGRGLVELGDMIIPERSAR